MLSRAIEKTMSLWLKARGIARYADLTAEEKATYRAAEEAMSGRKLTDDDVAEFWDRTFDQITEKLSAPDLSPRERDFLIVELRLARKVRGFLATPEREASAARFAVEQQLAQH